MKIIVIVCIVVCGVTSQKTEDVKNSQVSKITKYREDCIQETQVDVKLIDKAESGDFTNDPKLMCFSKCFYQKAGLVSENGDLLLDAVKESIKRNGHGDKGLAAMDKCKDVKGKSPCETVFLVHKCYFLETH